MFGAMASLCTPWGLPALTLPFSVATRAFVLRNEAPLELSPVSFADTTAPEEHLGRRPGEHSKAWVATPSPTLPDRGGTTIHPSPIHRHH